MNLMEITKEAQRFEHNRDSGSDEELAGYYRQVEAACEGAGGVTGASDGREGRVTGEKSEDERVYPEISGKDTQAENGKTEVCSSRITKCKKKCRMSNAEIQRMTAELSEMRKLNQSLQQSNDDLRNRNGLMSRSEQEHLEEEIKDVRDRNSKLQTQVNQSSVKAVEQAQQKQEEAEKQARQAEYQAEREKKRADMEIQKARRKAKSEMEDMKEIQFFWTWGYLCVIFFSLIQNGAFQRDLMQLIMLPVNWCRKYAIWFEQLDYMGYSTGEVVFERIFSSAVIMAGIVGGVFLVWGGIERYRKIWDDIYKMVLIASFSFIAVLGNLIREYLPFNLLFVIFVINVGAVLIRIYLNNKNVGY
ncbi:MAG: DUF6040 family protein [Coprococcus sp.]